MRNRLGGGCGRGKDGERRSVIKGCRGVVNQAALGQLQRELDS